MSTAPVPAEGEILAAAERGVFDQRQAAVDDLVRLLAWADAHSGDPQAEPGAVPVEHGGPKLITVGGEGTPGVEDLCFAEIAIARHAGEVATQHATADALDLRHRLPLTWAGTQALTCEAWVARKVARMSRSLSRDAVKIVDAAVAAALHESPGRILVLAEAKVIEADRAAHQQRIEHNQTRKGVWLSEPRAGETVDDLESTAGVRTLTGRLEEADALELHQLVEELADLLADHGTHDPDNPPSRDQLRADALALLGRPADALTLLEGTGGLDTGSLVPHEPYSTNEEGPVVEPVGTRPHRAAVLHVHLAADTISTGSTGDGVARVEELGPRLLSELPRLLDRRDLTLAPVIDLNQVHNVNHYEHPTAVKTRTALRVHGDAFPHTTARAGARTDHDHPTPYDRDGPPGQTGDHNDAPLTRRHHRAKTHAGHQLDQLHLGVYRWRTPHGLARVVTPTGTRRVELITDPDGNPIGEIYRAAGPIEIDWSD